VYGGRPLDMEVVHLSILLAMFDLVLGWSVLLASQVLASRAAPRCAAEDAA
jgi:hypothetical protein